MKVVRYRLLAVLVAAAALAVPASVSAHPSVYTDIARIDTNPAAGPFTLADQTRHVVTNHGFTMVLRETNGATTMGVMDYSRLPGDYRATLSTSERLNEGNSPAQAHATCRGVAALETVAAITGWQEGDPFYNYVPFQDTAAGLEDDPAHWVDDVLALTGVDLTTVTDDAAACVGIGGTYTPADETQTTTASLNSGFAHELAAPLEAEIATLHGEVAALEAEVAALTAGGGGSDVQAQSALQAEVAQLKLETATLRVDSLGELSVSQLSGAGATVKLKGPAGKSVKVRMLVRWAAAKKLGLKSRVIAEANGTIGKDATASIQIKSSKAFKGLKGSRKLTVVATAADRVAMAGGTLKP